METFGRPEANNNWLYDLKKLKFSWCQNVKIRIVFGKKKDFRCLMWDAAEGPGQSWTKGGSFYDW